MLNQDYREMLSLFLEGEAEFVVVGAYALAVHGVPRATGDIDLFVNPTEQNSAKVYRCLASFGAPVRDIASEDFATPGIVFQVGVAPRRIDIITMIDGVSFDEAAEDAVQVDMEGLVVPVISKRNLIKNKESTNRPKDRLDAESLRNF